MSGYPSYRDIDSAWITRIPAHWSALPVKYVCTYNDEVLPETADPETAIQYVEISDVDQTQGLKGSQAMLLRDAPSRARRLVRDGDVIVSTVRTYLRAVAPINDPPGNLVVSTGFAVVRPDDLAPGFARYVLVADGFVGSVVARSTGVSYPAINASDLVRIPVPVPPLDEQIAIASYLDAETARIDGLIDEKRRLLETTRELRQATIAQLVTGSNLQSRKAASRIKWLAEIPADWQSAQLRHVCDVVTDGAHVSPDSSSPDYHFVSTVDIKDGRIDFENSLRTSASSFDVMRRTGCCPLVGDVLFSKDGTIGRTTVVDDERPFAVASSLVIIRPDSQIIDSRFLNHWLNHRTLKEELELLLAGAALRRISVEKVARLDIAFPDIRTQREIAAEIDDELVKADSLIAHVTREIELLQELRSATITDAVLGRIDVREHMKN